MKEKEKLNVLKIVICSIPYAQQDEATFHHMQVNEEKFTYLYKVISSPVNRLKYEENCGKQ